MELFGVTDARIDGAINRYVGHAKMNERQRVGLDDVADVVVIGNAEILGAEEALGGVGEEGERAGRVVGPR